MISSKILGSGKNLTLTIKGILDDDLELQLLMTLSTEQRRAKIASFLWVVQEKMGIRLWWDKETPLMTMESRNSLRFDRPMQVPEKWNGELWIEAYGVKDGYIPKHFWITLDLDV